MLLLWLGKVGKVMKAFGKLLAKSLFSLGLWLILKTCFRIFTWTSTWKIFEKKVSLIRKETRQNYIIQANVMPGPCATPWTCMAFTVGAMFCPKERKKHRFNEKKCLNIVKRTIFTLKNLFDFGLTEKKKPLSFIAPKHNTFSIHSSLWDSMIYYNDPHSF